MELTGQCEECGAINEYEVEGKNIQDHPLQVPCDNCGAWVAVVAPKPLKTYKKREERSGTATA